MPNKIYPPNAKAKNHQAENHREAIQREVIQPARPLWRVATTDDVGRNFCRASQPMCFTPYALEELLATVGALPPETGAKLFGPKDSFGCDAVSFDVPGSLRASRVVYAPDVQWGERQTQYHLYDQLDEAVRVWHGDAHSHPGGSGIPSLKSGDGLGDLGYVEKVFASNEWMQHFAIPILTGTGEGEGKIITIWPWIVSRNAPHQPMLASLHVVPVSEFPVRQFNPEWERRISRPQLSTPSGPCAVHPEDFPQSEEHAAPQTGSTPLLKQHGAVEVSDKFRAQFRSRVEGAVSENLADKRVLIVGCGAGSQMICDLVRSGINDITLCDPDIVELHNLARTTYRVSDIGALKVEALAKQIAEINPAVSTRTCTRSLLDLSEAEQFLLTDGADLIVAGTDSFDAQSLLNELSQRYSTPAIFIGIHAGGQGGRIVYSIPKQTSCYQCVAFERFLASRRGEISELNLAGEQGARFDTGFIDSVALKIAIGILERGEKSPAGRFFAALRGRNEIVVRTTPEYEWGGQIWNAILSDLPHEPKEFAREIKEQALFGMDAVALSCPTRSTCPACHDIVWI